MWHTIENLLGPLFNFCCSFNRQDWIYVMAGSVIIGYFFLRGFGSRTNY